MAGSRGRGRNLGTVLAALRDLDGCTVRFTPVKLCRDLVGDLTDLRDSMIEGGVDAGLTDRLADIIGCPRSHCPRCGKAE